jgi:hypothetical protein
MDSPAQAQTLRIFTESATLHRWQSYWLNQTVSIAGASWVWQQFDAGGIVSGDVSAEGSMTISVPATSITLPALRAALRSGHLVELRQYEFDAQLGRTGPPGGMALAATYIGEVVGMSGTFTRLSIEIGSALSPVGVQFPPRSMTSQLIGVPCQL